MEDEKLWWILEHALRDPSLPHALLLFLLHFLPFPSKPQPPPPPPRHIQRLFLLRSLLSSTSSHHPPSPTTLLSLERLLPDPRSSPPSPALCTTYSSALFYLSTVPGFAAEISAALSRVGEYRYAVELLQPWRALIARQEKVRSDPSDRVVSARDRAVFDLRGFVDGEFRAMEPPFLERCVQELRTENQKVATMEPSKKSDKGVAQTQTEAILKEKSPTRTDNKQDDGTYTPSRRSERVATPNKTQGNERKTLLTKTGAEGVDGDSTPIRKSDNIVNQKETRTHWTETSPANNEVNQADYTGTSTGGITSDRQNHISKENQPSPTKSCGTNREKSKGKETEINTNGATTSHANGTNVETNNYVSRGPAHSFMDRNPTAHVFEWNDSIDDSPEKEKACTSIPKKRAWQYEGQKGQKGHTPKRRQKCRWQPYEEDALRKAVLEFGKGNWKEILDNYPDEFAGRNAVDLKDKWRNMTRY